MPIFLPLIATAAIATAPAPSAEDRALFAAFKGVCLNVRSLDAMGRAARKGKWQAVEADAHPNLEALVNKGHEAALAQDPGARLSGSQFRRTVAGRTLFLVTSRYVDKDGAWSNGCRIYDFAATAPLPQGIVTALMGKAPTGIQPLPDGNSKYLWEPGWKSGHSVEASFSNGTDPVSQKFGLKGQILSRHAIGGF